MRALAIAAAGMNAQQTNLEVIANNIANINTTGFKRARAEFTDLIYQAERVAGAPTGGLQSTAPEGAYVGLGVRTAAIRSLHLQGAMTQTGSRFDLAINGRGWFQVAGQNGETLYTRAGAFSKNATGQLVTTDGYVVQPQIVIPTNATEYIVSESGQAFARLGDTAELQSLGQLIVANFANEAGLDPLGGNLYRETAASGAAVTGAPGEAGFGTLHQGYLEHSNVDPVKEITELISAQRAYEMNSKVIQAADDMFGTLARGVR
ncbi:MAG TPA: flagellar basal-body rod protein FlgG [Hyphomicrobiaceae bacterium]|jgi:flagellar basal-body rod protein FlgG|nr:flagellar basal-body rod protein FlgG [Hyphomicrobiaceae bacterium]